MNVILTYLILSIIFSIIAFAFAKASKRGKKNIKDRNNQKID